MKKIFVPDTNVLVHDPKSLFSFEDNDCVILPPVLDEMDRMKGRGGSAGYSAQEFWKSLEDLMEPIEPEIHSDGTSCMTITLPSGGRVLVYDHPKIRKMYCDDYLLKWVKEHEGSILVTRDRPLRIRAKMNNIPKADYLNDRVTKIYSGFRELLVSDKDICRFYQKGFLEAPEDAFPHQLFQLVNDTNFKQTALSIYKRGKLLPLHPCPEMPIKPRNRAQQMALSLLFDPDIKLVTLIGGAGSGKTLLSLLAGRKQTKNGDFRSMLLTRPLSPLGKDVGYLPGEKKEKLLPWMGPFIDNYRKIEQKKGEYQTPAQLYERMTEDGYIEIEAITYIRGRTLYEQFIIVDEAQNLTPHEAKAILTRVGEGSKIILAGDPTDNQIDNPFLTPYSNGLVYTAERMKHSTLSAHLQFEKTERSSLVEEIVQRL
ncbi:PhoH family protein [Neobacillus sp. YIM B02564]|uniref:PhoH family protein n=1 Tax=Neobacillus paridis TaxID=2803862 RepID=A0ABS1TMB5_9BACI|nr:PhoH family protein [Neobacillus paridis]